MFSISEYMHPQKTTQCQRHVILGQDQGSKQDIYKNKT